MRILGLDVGSRTVGIALSDEMGWTAQGMETLRFPENQLDQVIPQLAEYIRRYEIQTIVVGLPKNMDGTIGARGQFCLEFGQKLQAELSVDIVFWDERLTTVAAHKYLIEADMSRKKRKKVVDKIASVLILQSYLDSKSSASL
ncbi:MAG TPA: Holliday junction resolvase RuvX [Firmicutes bacterium]|nr:Holliday junction resolvase RuvX [Bacillales bacterium]HJA41250.1 Holliday junction resolvase RuvX [Bacillota bacterium]